MPQIGFLISVFSSCPTLTCSPPAQCPHFYLKFSLLSKGHITLVCAKTKVFCSTYSSLLLSNGINIHFVAEEESLVAYFTTLLLSHILGKLTLGTILQVILPLLTSVISAYQTLLHFEVQQQDNHDSHPASQNLLHSNLHKSGTCDYFIPHSNALS